MAHSEGDICVSLTKVKRLHANSRKRKIVILTLIVESHIECLIDGRSRLGRIWIISHDTHMVDR